VVKGWVIVTLYVSVVRLQMYLVVFAVMFMGLNVKVSVRVGGWPLKFPVSFVFSWFSRIWIWYVAWVSFVCRRSLCMRSCL